MLRAVVIGGSPSTWIELTLAQGMAEFDMVVAVNRAGVDYRGEIDHWVTYHPECFVDWITERELSNHTGKVKHLWTATGRQVESDLEVRRLGSWGGSSGLFGVAVALENGAERVALCGVPMDGRQGHYHDRSDGGKGNWSVATVLRPAWLKAMPTIKGKVRSFSGWTMKQLEGLPPSIEWLHGE